MDTTGSSGNSAGIKQRTIVLIGAVRTLMRSASAFYALAFTLIS